MVNIKKIIKIISWIIIALLGIALLLNWQTIESPVIIHADLSGNFSYGYCFLSNYSSNKLIIYI